MHNLQYQMAVYKNVEKWHLSEQWRGSPQKAFLAQSNFGLILPNYKNLTLAGNVDFALFSQLVMNIIN